MSFTPIEGSDIRVIFNPDSAFYEVQQRSMEAAHGATYPSDLGARFEIGVEKWAVRYASRTLAHAAFACVCIALAENVDIREIEVGLPAISPEVQLAIAAVTQVTL